MVAGVSAARLLACVGHVAAAERGTRNGRKALSTCFRLRLQLINPNTVVLPAAGPTFNQYFIRIRQELSPPPPNSAALQRHPWEEFLKQQETRGTVGLTRIP
jgi:hypothetical protein